MHGDACVPTATQPCDNLGEAVFDDWIDAALDAYPALLTLAAQCTRVAVLVRVRALVQ